MPPEKSSRMKTEFTHHGYAGQIDVAVRENHGVLSSGFSAIDLRFTDDMVRGFPVVNASVSFEGAGY